MQSKSKVLNANARMGRHHHKHYRHHSHHKHMGVLKTHAAPKLAVKHVTPRQARLKLIPPARFDRPHCPAAPAGIRPSPRAISPMAVGWCCFGPEQAASRVKRLVK